MTGVSSRRFVPFWILVLLGIQALAALAFVYIALLVGGSYPMPRPLDAQMYARTASPLLAVPAAYLACRLAARNGQNRLMWLMALLPLAVFAMVIA